MSSSTRSQASLLQETLDTALDRLQALEAGHHRLLQENLELRQRLEQQPPQPPALAPAVAASNGSREPKVASPEAYHGRNKSKLGHFLLGLNIVIKTQSSRFPDDESKINYAISFLRDDAMAWIEPFATKPSEDQPAYMKNYSLFIKELKTIFGDPDEVATAERSIRLLRQRGLASTYFADFRRYAAVLDWNDPALTSQAYTGLKDSIKDELARTGRPEGLDQLIEVCTRIDNRLHERQVERERAVPTTKAPALTSTPSSNSNSNNNNNNNNKPQTTYVVKTEGGSNTSTKRGPLSAEEKERRRREGLCGYCGKLSRSSNPPRPPSDCSASQTITFAAANQIRTSSLTSFTSLFNIVQDSPSIQVSSPSFNPSPANTLLDTAATRNYVDVEFSHRHSLPLKALVKPTPVIYADGSFGTEFITHTTTLQIAVSSGPQHQVTFYVTPLRSHHLFLGLPWFKDCVATLDFSRLRLTYSVASPTTLSSGLSTSSNSSPNSDLPEVSLSASQRREIFDNSSTFPSLSVPPEHARQLSTTEDSSIRANLPEPYHDYVDVFRKSSADLLPDHRSYDHKIPMQPNTTPPFGPIYSLSEGEHQELRNYLKENLDKGFIRPSSSPAGAPVLFVPKPDGTFRMCVDYRGINNITIKDRYAIPKIDDLLDRIRGSTIFSKIDLRGAYNLLRISEGEEWKTCFRTRYGSYEYLVMPFGLCNAPSSFQRFMNDIFRNMVDVFIVIYLDDILIFSKTAHEHEHHVKKVLERLRSTKLFAKAEKCEFSRDSVEFLGYRLSKDGVTMVMDKVNSVLSWPAPKSVKQLQSFLGFANFYRRFIWRYSEIVAPLTALLRKDTPWAWNEGCQTAFDSLKTAFTSAPVLQHFDPSKPITVETYASDYAIAAVASQPDENGRLRPVAYRSRKMDPAELNYEIHDKEMLAIVDTLQEWRHLLQDPRHTVTIFTDHKNLEYFTTSKLLNRRQARWSMKLTEYDFKIIYRPGHQGGKPDALTRRPDYHPGTAAHHFAENNPHNHITLLPKGKHNFDDAPVVARATFVVEPNIDLQMRIKDAYTEDSLAQKLLSTPTKDYSVNDQGLILHKQRIYVPEPIRVEVIKSRHDHPLAGHPGRRKTLSLLRRDYFWPSMRNMVEDYVDSCDPCARTKVPRHKPYGLLKSLPIAKRPWTDISMDLIEGLPPSNGFDTILVIVERLTKMSLFIPTHSTLTAPELSKLYLHHVFSKHSLPSNIVSDRGSEFTSSFWRSLCQLLNIEQSLSTAYHPQTDGQTERVNQNLEQYLRLYTSYQQDDWADLLPLAEFTYNNTEHSTTSVSPFFANKGFNPSFDITPTTAADNPAAHPQANDLVTLLGHLHQHLRDQIAEANETSKTAYDRKHLQAPVFSVGELVMLSAKHIRSKRPTAKLDNRFLGPFKIIACISSYAYRLELPSSMRIHNVFHVSLLESHKSNTLPDALFSTHLHFPTQHSHIPHTIKRDPVATPLFLPNHHNPRHLRLSLLITTHIRLQPLNLNMHSIFDNEPITHLWALWTRMPDTTPSKSVIGDLLTFAIEDCKPRFPTTSSLQDPKDIFRSDTDWTWISNQFQLDTTIETFNLDARRKHLTTAGKFDIWAEKFFDIFSAGMFLLPTGVSSVRNYGLHVLRAGTILAPMDRDIRFVIQGTILVLEWGTLARDMGYGRWTSSDPMAYLKDGRGGPRSAPYSGAPTP
ncbi:hypothetical protein A4X03_0g7031, partial [Tilletia caries]